MPYWEVTACKGCKTERRVKDKLKGMVKGRVKYKAIPRQVVDASD